MKRFALLALLTALAAPSGAQAQRVDQLPQQEQAPAGGARIVAVVNDGVISSNDVNARMAMAFLASGLPNTPEVRQHLLVQTLHSLVDEQLQIAEAKRVGVVISQEEIDQAMNRIAEENKIPGGDMRAYMMRSGVPPEALMSQIRAGLSWTKVIQRELRPRVEIGDDEIDAVIERMRANAGKEEYLVSEIFLSVDNPKDEERVKQFADSLVAQLKQPGGNFGAIARQFSQSAGAASGGDIGWIQSGQLSPELDKALATMQQGAIAGPLRSASGYHILGLREKRTISLGDPKDITVELQQAFRPFGAAPDKTAIQNEAAQLRQTMVGCANLASRLQTNFPAWHWQDLGEVKITEVPAWLATASRELPVGRASEAMATDKGALILFVCNRKVPEGTVNRDAIANSIGTEKLELQARGLLRDLRRDAYLDIRLASFQ